jgi:nucleoside-diphosphate-sugar epimerase
MLIEAAKNVKVKKFILVSSMYVTRPENYTGYFMFNKLDDWLGNKLKSENYLRKSGLNYSILRPGILEGEEGGNRNFM